MRVKIRKINSDNKDFPELLENIPNPPKSLYIKGNIKDFPNINTFKNKKEQLQINKTLNIAVVGTRKISNYGRQMTKRFVRVLSKAGITIVSGLALGIDGLAHKTALKYKTKTIAVLGSGLNKIYPKTHTNLAKKIIKSKGAIISEYKSNSPPYKNHFIERNRIISGLSQAVLIVEAPKRSGALITARNAIEQKRKLFVIPGRITDKNSVGANKLIRKKGILVQNPNQILKKMGVKPDVKKKKDKNNLSKKEKLILKHLSKEPIHVDKIAKKLDIPTNELVSVLSQMELKGIIKNFGNNQYIKD